MADVDKITEDMKVTQQQAGQIEQMAHTIKDLEGRTKVLANKVTEKSFELSQTDFNAKFKVLLAEMKNNPDMLNNMVQTGMNNGQQ
jgi:acetolactate synthase small subunit